MPYARFLNAAVAVSLLAVAPPGALAASTSKAHAASFEQRSEQAEAAIRDAWLDGKLETALLFNEHLNSFAIDTEVADGTAYLSGAVESDIDRDLAEQIARSIDGISAVENKLEVDQKAAAQASQSEDAQRLAGLKQSVSDATLTARVKGQLMLNSNVSGLAIDVDSNNGTVTLSGQVDSEQEKELARQIAANTEGTSSVENRLRVDSEEAE